MRISVGSPIIALAPHAVSLSPCAAAQTGSQIKPNASSKPKAEPKAPRGDGEIVVTGERINPPDGLPVTVSSQPPLGRTKLSRRLMSDARMFVRCAKPDDRTRLRDAIDGPAHQFSSDWAVDWIIRTHSACYAGFPAGTPMPAPYYGECNAQLTDPQINYAICRSFYDRGAILERVLETYAADLHFEGDALRDPAVVAFPRPRGRG